MLQAERMPETTHIPMTFRSRGDKTAIVLPDGSRGVVRREATIDNAIKVIPLGQHSFGHKTSQNRQAPGVD